MNLQKIGKNFSRNLKQLRTSRKVTQKQLAENIGVQASSICNYENEKENEKENSSLPSLGNLIFISQYFGIDIDSLLFDSFEEFGSEEIDLNKSGMRCIDFGSPEYQKFLDQKYFMYFYNTSSAYSSEINFSTFEVYQNKERHRYDISMTIKNMHKESIKQYSGNLILTSRHIYLYFRGMDHYERSLAILHYPNGAANPYIGGLGLIISISSGKRKDPCMQKMFIINNEIKDLEKYKNELFSLLDLSNSNQVIRMDEDLDDKAFRLIKRINAQE